MKKKFHEMQRACSHIFIKFSSVFINDVVKEKINLQFDEKRNFILSFKCIDNFIFSQFFFVQN